MRATILIATFLSTLALAAPLPVSRVGTALRSRQSSGASSNGAGSTSTSTTNNGLLSLGLVGGKHSPV
jgi:hypothetical protein